MVSPELGEAGALGSGLVLARMGLSRNSCSGSFWTVTARVFTLRAAGMKRHLVVREKAE